MFDKDVDGGPPGGCCREPRQWPPLKLMKTSMAGPWGCCREPRQRPPLKLMKTSMAGPLGEAGPAASSRIHQELFAWHRATTDEGLGVEPCGVGGTEATKPARSPPGEDTGADCWRPSEPSRHDECGAATWRDAKPAASSHGVGGDGSTEAPRPARSRPSITSGCRDWSSKEENSGSGRCRGEEKEVPAQQPQLLPKGQGPIRPPTGHMPACSARGRRPTRA
jgi:hypothetical protein